MCKCCRNKFHYSKAIEKKSTAESGNDGTTYCQESGFEFVNGMILTVHLVDLRVGGQDLVGKFLRRGQHFSMVRCDQILHEFLQLVPVHLEERLGDGQPQLHLLSPADAVQREGHHVGAVEDVTVATAACHRRDLAAVKADRHTVRHFRLRVCG